MFCGTLAGKTSFSPLVSLEYQGLVHIALLGCIGFRPDIVSKGLMMIQDQIGPQQMMGGTLQRDQYID